MNNQFKGPRKIHKILNIVKMFQLLKIFFSLLDQNKEPG